MQRTQPKRSIKFEGVPTFAVSGFFGGINPNEGHVSFFQDSLIPKIGQQPGQIILETVEHNFVANVKMSPAVFKRLATWMMEHVKRYESHHGEIQLGHPKQKQEPDQPSYYG